MGPRAASPHARGPARRGRQDANDAGHSLRGYGDDPRSGIADQLPPTRLDLLNGDEPIKTGLTFEFRNVSARLEQAAALVDEAGAALRIDVEEAAQLPDAALHASDQRRATIHDPGQDVLLAKLVDALHGQFDQLGELRHRFPHARQNAFSAAALAEAARGARGRDAPHGLPYPARPAMIRGRIQEQEQEDPPCLSARSGNN